MTLCQKATRRSEWPTAVQSGPAAHLAQVGEDAVEQGGLAGPRRGNAQGSAPGAGSALGHQWALSDSGDLAHLLNVQILKPSGTLLCVGFEPEENSMSFTLH